jgi:acetylserotonin N-methyltransferase
MSESEAASRSDRLLWDVWLSHYQYPTLACADELGLFRRLEAGPLTFDALRDALSLAPRPAEILLGMMRALGFIERQQRSAYSLTDTARVYLLPSSESYWGPAFRSRRSVLQDQIMRALKSDRAPGIEWGSSLCDQWSAGMSSETSRVFIEAMHAQSARPAWTLAELALWSGVRTLLDVAGGSGVFSLRIAERHPNTRIQVLELPGTAAFTRRYVASSPAAMRIEVVERDMFDGQWPAPVDAVLASNVFHDWSASACQTLARRAFAALRPGGQLHLHEMVLGASGDEPLSAVCFSMAMLLQTDGKQYSLSELREILCAAGFADVSARAALGYFSLVTASKPQR